MSAGLLNPFVSFPSAGDEPPQTGLIGWWEAADTTDGAAVSTWTNKTGGVDLTTVATYANPQGDTVSGIRVVSFDAANTELMEALELEGNTDPDPMTFVAAYSTSETGSTDRPYGYGSNRIDGSGSKEHINIALDPSLRFDGAAISGSYGASHPTSMFVRTVIRNGTSFTDRFDGTQVKTGTASLITVKDDFYVGCLFGSVTTTFDVACILVYDTNLSGTDLTDAEQYVADQAGVTL